MTTTSKTVRIATVKASGARYIVQSLDFRSDLAFCWGEVVWVQGTRVKCEPGKRFPLADVEIATVPRTSALCVELFEQAVAGRAAAGHTLVVRGRKHVTVTDLGRVERFVRDLPEALRVVALELGMSLDAEISASDRATIATLSISA